MSAGLIFACDLFSYARSAAMLTGAQVVKMARGNLQVGADQRCAAAPGGVTRSSKTGGAASASPHVETLVVAVR